jgi:hypothetical protein
MLCRRTFPCTQSILISQYVIQENMSVYTIHPDFTICYAGEHVRVHNPSWFHIMLCRRTCPCTQSILISQYVMQENMSVYTIHPNFTICYAGEHVRVHNPSWFHIMLCRRTCPCTQSILISQYVMQENMSVYTIHPDFTLCYAGEHVRVHNPSWFHIMLCRRTCPCTQSILISQYVMQENMSVYTIHPDFTICYAGEHVRVHNPSWFHNMLCRITCPCTQSILISQYVMQENMSVYTIHPDFTICYAGEHVRVHNPSWFHNMLCRRTCPCTQSILISQYVMQENMSVYTIHPDFTICYAGEHVRVHNSSWFHNMLCLRTCLCTQFILISQYVMYENMSVYTIHHDFTICYVGEHVHVHNSSWFHNMLCMRTCPCTQFIMISQYVMYENMSVYTIQSDFTICYAREHVRVHNSSWFHNMLCRRTCPCIQSILISHNVMQENMSVYTIHPDFTICYVWEHVRVHNSSWFHNMLCMRTCPCTQFILISQYVMYENMSMYTIHPDFTICYAGEHVHVHNSSWFHNMLCMRTCLCTQSILISQYVMYENMSVYTFHPDFTVCYVWEHVCVHNPSWFHNMLCMRTCPCTQSILISQYVMQ